MNQRDMEWTLGRLLTDQGFREAFFLDPGRACMQFSGDEVEALLRVPRPVLAQLGKRLRDRICRLPVNHSTTVTQ